MRIVRIGLLVIACALASASAHGGENPWWRPGPDGAPQVRLYFFWSLTCPHCNAARPFVEAIPARLPWVALHSFELSRHPGNVGLYREIVRELGEDAGVPAFLVCGELRIGWDSDATTGAELERALASCRDRAVAGESVRTGKQETASDLVQLPFLGAVPAASLSLPVLTLTLAGLDAFNPCAFFVLLFLLSMLAHQKNRPRMLLVGGIFVLSSGLMYFAFMAAWLNIFQLIGHMGWVTAAAGGIALLIGSLNVKDFFAIGRGPSLSISEAGRSDIFRRARVLVSADSLPAMLAASAFLAVAANFYELLCTAGFPMIYARVLTLNEPSVAMRYVYLASYNFIYVVPMALIVVVFVRMLGARKLTERGGRLLKLLSGLMMLGLGALLLAAPELAGDALAGLALVAGAAATAGLAAWLTRGSG